MLTLKYDKTGGSTRLTRQDTILFDRNFKIGLYHVLREICRKFDRVSSVKQTSLYFKSRARPAIKLTSRIYSTKNSGWASKLQYLPNRVHQPTHYLQPTQNIKNTDIC